MPAKRERLATAPRRPVPVAYVFAEVPDHESQPTPLSMEEHEIVIGRIPPADVCVPYPPVSRRHLVLRVRDRKVEAQDVSKHGTRLNGEPMVRERWVVLGDVATVYAKFELVDRNARITLVSADATPSPRISLGVRIADAAIHRVEAHGRQVTLSPTEFEILEKLFQADGQTVSKNVLQTGRHRPLSEGQLRVHIHNIRGDLGERPVPGTGLHCHLQTVDRDGYRLAR